MKACDMTNKQGNGTRAYGTHYPGQARFQRSCRFAAREILTIDQAFQQRAFALKSVNAMNKRLLRRILTQRAALKLQENAA
jgi:hypothetical protein